VVQQSSPDFSEYLAVLRRRRWHLILPMVLILFVSLGLAFGLPPVYQSTATILIEQQEIPMDLVRSTVTSYAAERIQIISKRVLTRENLWAIVERSGLFPGERERQERSDILATMRENIKIEMLNADIINPSNGRTGKAAIAFNLSFDGNDPVAAQKVVSELVSLYLSENKRIRTEKAAVTSGFLAEEVGKMSRHIAELEARLARFKERNAGRLPELMKLNMTLMERSEQALESSERQITTLKERESYLESQLAQLKPNTEESPEGRLRAMQAEYLRISAIYSQDHPDIVRLRREIAALKVQVGSVSDVSELEARIQKVRESLVAAREHYSEQHPDVIKLKQSLLALTQALQEARQNQPEGLGVVLEPDNPAYVSTHTQLKNAKISLDAAYKKRARFKKKLALYEERLTQTPRVEQEGLSLRREYDNAVKKFHDLKQKQLQAQVAEQLEKESKGERFSLIESPVLPVSPIKPNRLGILLLGTVLSMAGGLGFASFSEFFDRTIRGSRALVALLNAPPLAVIPYIKTEADFKRNRRRAWLITAMVFATIAVILAGIHIFWMPLDLLWSTGLANMGWQEAP